MAHSRKDTFVKPPEWWKHMRPYNKRKISKVERKYAKERIAKEVIESKSNE